MTDPKFDAIRELVNEMDQEELTWVIHDAIDAAEAAYVERVRDLSEIKASPNHSLCRKDAKMFRARIAELEEEKSLMAQLLVEDRARIAELEAGSEATALDSITPRDNERWTTCDCGTRFIFTGGSPRCRKCSDE